MQQWQVGPVPEYIYNSNANQPPNEIHPHYASDMSRRQDHFGYGAPGHPPPPHQHHGVQPVQPPPMTMPQPPQVQQPPQQPQHPVGPGHHQQPQHHPQQPHHSQQPPHQQPHPQAHPQHAQAHAQPHPQQQQQQGPPPQAQQAHHAPAPQAPTPAPRNRKRAAPSSTPAAAAPPAPAPVTTAPPVSAAPAPAPPVSAPAPTASAVAPPVAAVKDEAPSTAPPAKKSRTNTPWTPAEEQRLKQMRDAGNSWAEIAKTFPTRTEGSVKKHWYKDMHYAEFAEDESQALMNAIKEYENNKWKVIGQKVGKPAKACEQYAKEHFPDLFQAPKAR